MKRKTNQIIKCTVCTEEDYGDFMDTIDGKPYCQSCAMGEEDRQLELIKTKGE